jgi:hypothetical protein
MNPASIILALQAAAQLGQIANGIIIDYNSGRLTDEQLDDKWTELTARNKLSTEALTTEFNAWRERHKTD